MREISGLGINYYFDFEKLDVYQLAEDFANLVLSIILKFPLDARKTVGYQLGKAALSLCLNIAEGSVYSKKQFSHYIDIARGSALECMSCLRIALKQKHVSQEEFDKLAKMLVQISKMFPVLKNL